MKEGRACARRPAGYGALRRAGLTRREFMARACAAGAGVCLGAGVPLPSLAAASGWREASWYKRLPGKRVHCLLCPCNPFMKQCGILSDGQTCVCRVRTNVGGKLYMTNYGRACAINVDPVAKSPLYHVLPGAKALALAAPGCNLECKCCQNWEMSQAGVDDTRNFYAPPDELVRRAKEAGCQAIAYTYTEPVIYYEYLMDTAALAKKNGMRNFVSTGGYIMQEPLRELCRHVDAFSVSVKGFSENFYLKYCRGHLLTVLQALKTIRDAGVWLEIPTLIIPTLSDDKDGIRWFCSWVYDNLGPDVPMHLTRFTPAFQLKDLPTTPVQTLESARSIAMKEGLRYVYIGNVPGHDANNTNCPSCKRLVIQRVGFRIISNKASGGTCSHCGTRMPGLWA